MQPSSRRPQFRLVDDLLVLAGLACVLVALWGVDWRLALGIVGLMLTASGVRR